jgi:hypothetical protein
MAQHKFSQDQYAFIPQFISDADRNSIPAELLPCIDLQESSGGKRYVRDSHNPFGWGSDNISFESESGAINYISAQLGSGKYYFGKTLAGKLKAYNPNPSYAREVQSCIKSINIK